MRNAAARIDHLAVRLIAASSKWLTVRLGVPLGGQLTLAFLGLAAWLVPIYIKSPWMGLLGRIGWPAATVADLAILMVGWLAIVLVTSTALSLAHSWFDTQTYRREHTKKVSAYTAWGVFAGAVGMSVAAYYYLQPSGILHTWQEPLPLLALAWHAFVQRGLASDYEEPDDPPDDTSQLLRMLQQMPKEED